jgi:aspartate racemase
MKTAGILGGLGPETTARFYELVVLKSYYQKSKDKRPPVLIWSVPMEIEIENDFIKSKEHSAEYVKYLTEGAKRLQDGGADFIVIPCNAVHVFIDRIRSSVDIPVLSIVEETIQVTKRDKKPLILVGIGATISSNMYQEAFDSNDIEYRTPEKPIQKRVNKLVASLINAIGGVESEKTLEKIIKETKPNADELILLAGTDLQLLIREFKSNQVIDTMEILADAVVEKIHS